MFALPLSVVEWLGRHRLVRRPRFLTLDVDETPDESELTDNILMREIRGGYLKWAHLKCPQCGEHIRLPLAGDPAWRLKVDFLRRPSVHPSIWQTGSCGAHFFVRRGKLLDC